MAEGARRTGEVAVDRSEGFGERLLGRMLDRAHEMPPQLIAPLVAEEIAGIGGWDVSILLLDYSQQLLVPLPGKRLSTGPPELVGDTPAGAAFTRGQLVEHAQGNGVRVFLPLLDGSDAIGVLAVTHESVDDDDRRLLRRLAGLVANTLVVKSAYTDRLSQARRREPLSLSAEIQWSLLPPSAMSTPQVAVAGVLEPAYDAAGDSFDYALNDNVLDAVVLDAMGHGLDAAVMASVAVGAHRNARRENVPLGETYAHMDRAIAQQFGPDHFVTAHLLRLDVNTGRLQWVNAGHLEPLLIRDHRVVGALHGPVTLPVGFGADAPQVREQSLHPGDRILFFTDGLVEKRPSGGTVDDEKRLISRAETIGPGTNSVQEMARRLSFSLLHARGGQTNDDATVFIVEWRGGQTADLER